MNEINTLFYSGRKIIAEQQIDEDGQPILVPDGYEDDTFKTGSIWFIVSEQGGN